MCCWKHCSPYINIRCDLGNLADLENIFLKGMANSTPGRMLCLRKQRQLSQHVSSDLSMSIPGAI